MGMNHVYVGLGSNLGDRSLNLKSAIGLMAERGITVLKTSSVYETVPVGPPQPDFLNAVCAADTELSVRELLSTLQLIEQEMGRVPAEKWGPRIIDLDILLFADLMLTDDDLTVPHPELTKRNFAMIPLLEIAPDLDLPSGEPLSVYCDPKDPGVRKIGELEEK
jgi:2-amino-4-hydroxy-6-hydroxymethyldihydropteridine diphosphokinase